MKKRIALFGGTGQTGSLFLEKALSQGYSLKALVRTPSKLTISHQELEVIEGDILNSEDVARTIQDCEVVVSLFGHVKASPEWLQTNGTKHIVSAMKTLGLKKIISLSGGGLPFPEKDAPKFVDKLIRTIMKITVPKILNDAIAHYEVLKKSELDWIIVRGPRLTNEAPKGTYQVSWVGINSGTKIARGDLADFILQQVEEEQFVRQMPFVSY